MTKQEIIEETVEYYKNNPFGYNLNTGKCVYRGPEGQMCAVGRCLVHPELYGNEDISAHSLLVHNTDNSLKEEYQGHQPEFWNRLQSFHDECAKKYFRLEDYKTHWALKEYYDRQEA